MEKYLLQSKSCEIISVENEKLVIKTDLNIHSIIQLLPKNSSPVYCKRTKPCGSFQMIRLLIHNEFQKIFYRKRTYIGFILIGVLIPFIVGAIDNGGSMLEKSIYGQLSDSFFL